tara:strand:+ start:477 stop:653 length:177 start_codon:yes stop_codon:yes gene_type:complete
MAWIGSFILEHAETYLSVNAKIESREVKPMLYVWTVPGQESAYHPTCHGMTALRGDGH